MERNCLTFFQQETLILLKKNHTFFPHKEKSLLEKENNFELEKKPWKKGLICLLFYIFINLWPRQAALGQKSAEERIVQLCVTENLSLVYPFVQVLQIIKSINEIGVRGFLHSLWFLLLKANLCSFSINICTWGIPMHTSLFPFIVAPKLEILNN